MTANGRNNSRYVKDNHRLRRTLDPVCAWCGKPINLSLHHNDPMAWTSDHVVELHKGGDLYGERVPMHRSCNSSRSNGKPKPLLTQPVTTTEDW